MQVTRLPIIVVKKSTHLKSSMTEMSRLGLADGNETYLICMLSKIFFIKNNSHKRICFLCITQTKYATPSKISLSIFWWSLLIRQLELFPTT